MLLLHSWPSYFYTINVSAFCHWKKPCWRISLNERIFLWYICWMVMCLLCPYMTILCRARLKGNWLGTFYVMSTRMVGCKWKRQGVCLCEERTSFINDNYHNLFNSETYTIYHVYIMYITWLPTWKLSTCYPVRSRNTSISKNKDISML